MVTKQKRKPDRPAAEASQRSGSSGRTAAVSPRLDPLIFLLFLLTPLVWTSGPDEPFLAVKWLLLTYAVAAATMARSRSVLDWFGSLRINPRDALLPAIYAWAVLSALFCSQPISGFRTLVLALPFLLLFPLLRTSPEARRSAVGATLLAAWVNVFVSLGQLASFPPFLFGLGEEPIGLLGNRNHLAAFLAMALPLLLWREGDGRQRSDEPMPLAFKLSAFLALVVLLSTSCRGAVLALLAGGFILARGAAGFRPTVARTLTLLIAATSIVLVLAAAPSRTGQARALTWSITSRGALARPVLGHGPGSFENQFPLLQEQRFRGLDRDEVRLASGAWRFARNHRQPHNDWLQIIFDLGFPAGFMLLGLVVASLRDPATSPAARAALATAAVMGLTSFPLSIPATAALATLSLALCMPAWRPMVTGPTDPGWSMGYKGWLAVCCLILVVLSGSRYLGQARHGAGRRLLQAGRLAEAETVLQESLRFDPSSGKTRASLGRVFEADGRHRYALAAFEDAATDYLDSAVIINQGVSLRSLGRKKEALARFRRALAMLPSDSDSWYFLSLALDESGEAEAARAAMSRAKELSVLNYKAYLQAAIMAARQGHAGDAARWFQENLVYMAARMAQDDPAMSRLDPIKRAYFARSAAGLIPILEHRHQDQEARALRQRVSGLYPEGLPGWFDQATGSRMTDRATENEAPNAAPSSTVGGPGNSE